MQQYIVKISRRGNTNGNRQKLGRHTLSKNKHNRLIKISQNEMK